MSRRNRRAMQRPDMRTALLALGLVLLLAVLAARAQEFFEAPREFVIDTPCEAYTSFKRRSGGTPLEVGRSYPGRGLNRESDPSHVYVRVGGESKWVDLSCGHFADGPAPEVRRKEPRAAQCLPFFDDVDNPAPQKLAHGGKADITPPPPALDAFDRAVMATCGPAGKVVSREEFKALMRAHPGVLARVKAFTGGTVFAGKPRASDDAWLDDLAEAWFAVHAFDHVMCGEPGDKGTIGGLHFHGRYVQLQETGDACRMDNYRRNEVEKGVIYTFGVVMKGASGQWFRHAIKGYGLTLSAEDILKAATRAFAANPTPSSESHGCLLPLTDDGHAFTTVFVRRAQGIRTFYPDATPGSAGGKPTPPCAGPISLQ